MSRIKDPLLRAALLIHRRLASRCGTADRAGRIGPELPDACRLLVRAWDRQRLARRRSLNLSAARLEEQVLSASQRVRQAAAALAHTDTTPTLLPPAPALLWAELRQLHEEFDSAEVDLRQGVIAVTTEPLVLEGVQLGPFTIELHLDRLHYHDGSCFDCVALEPNGANGNDSVTHPHVQDNSLCAGDAACAIGEALRQGRLCDAFLLVAGVLRTYSPASPYVRLADWDGVRCSACDDTVHSDELYFCEHCERDVCDECRGVCDVCHTRCCQACLEYDVEANHCCCPNCRETCSDCGRWVSKQAFDAPTALCPQCLEGRQQPDQKEVDPEQPDPSTTALGTENNAAA